MNISNQTIKAIGISRKEYIFNVYPIKTEFNALAGVYEFVYQVEGRWYAVYIGETDNFARRLYEDLEYHHQWDCIKKNGATHIALLSPINSKVLRLQIEQDIRSNYNTVCNKQ